MEDTIQLPWIAFMAHIPHSQIDYVEQTLKEYDIGLYIIGLEKTDYEHMHFLVEMKEIDYHKYSKRVFKDKFKLRGRAIKNAPRQYGKLKQIEDLEKLKAYTVKDQNIRSNMKQEDLDTYIELSFKKEDKLKFTEECIELLEERYNEAMIAEHGSIYYAEPNDAFFYPRVARLIIIDIFKQKELKGISKNKIDNVLLSWMMKKTDSPYHPTSQNIYDLLYPFN